MFFFLSTQSLLYNLFTFSFLLRFTSFFVLSALKRRFILCTRDSGNTMRFSLRNSRVKISFLYLRGLLAFFSSPFLYIPPTPFSSPTISSRNPSRKKSLYRVEHLLLLIIYATNARVFSLDFLLSREEIDRFSFTPLYSLLLSLFSMKFSFFDFRAFLSSRSSRNDFLVSQNSLQTRIF